jgi:predicted Zn-dependent protease
MARDPKARGSRRVTAGVVAALLIGAGGWVGVPWVRGHQAWRQAQARFDADDPAAARDRLRECAAVWPGDAEVAFALARATRRAGDPAAAEPLLARAEQLGWPQEAIQLERLLANVQTTGDRTGEATLHRLIHAGTPEEPAILEALVLGYLQQHQAGRAEQWGRVWAERYPAEWRPPLLRGRALELADHKDEAIAQYRRVLEKVPAHFEARFRLGELLFRNGQYREALPQLEACHGARPDDVPALVALANCLRNLGGEHLEHARTLLDAWLAAHPGTDVPVVLARAQVAKDLEGPDAALPWLRRVEQTAPRDATLILLLAQVYKETGDKENAEKYERKRADLEQLVKRLDAVEKAIQRQPDDPALRYEAGSLLMKLGHEGPALRWFGSVLELDPNHPPTHLALADYYAAKGEKERAQDHRLTAEGKKRARVQR